MTELVPTPIMVNGKEEVIDVPPFTVFVHQPGIRVDIPSFVEINSRKTIECMEKMNQKEWEHISTGQLFQILFKECFNDESDNTDVPIPKTIQELNSGDYGTIHIAGMIVLGCEAIFEGKTKLFFRTPEDHLHPKLERKIVSMFKKMFELLNPDGEGVATLEKEE